MRTIYLLACLSLSLVIPGGFAAVGAQTPAAGLNWAPCPPVTTGAATPGVAADSDLECATLQVPVDWNHPDGPTFGLAIADMEVDLRAARLLTLHAARLKDRGHHSPEAVSVAKLFATEAALKAATTAIQLHGSRAYTDELPIEPGDRQRSRHAWQRPCPSRYRSP